MSQIVVYFIDVVNRRRVWRRVSKACKRCGARVDNVFEIRDVSASELNAIYGTIVMYGKDVF